MPPSKDLCQHCPKVDPKWLAHTSSNWCIPDLAGWLETDCPIHPATTESEALTLLMLCKLESTTYS